jgi:hypothetical protein
MKRIFLIVAIFITYSTSQAAQLAGYAGINSTEYAGSGNWDRNFGIDFGALYFMPLKQDIYLRTGAGLAQRNSEIGNIGVDYLLLEIPATLMMTINSSFSIFGGLNFNLVLDDDDVRGSKSFVFNLPIGARFQLEGPHAIEAFLEFGITDLASSGGSDIHVGNVIGGKYVYTFQTNL